MILINTKIEEEIQGNKSFLNDALKYLIQDRSCDQKLTNIFGKTALQLACQNNLPLKVIELMDCSTVFNDAQLSLALEHDTFEHFFTLLSPNYTIKIKLLKMALFLKKNKVVKLLMKSISIKEIFTEHSLEEEPPPHSLLRCYCIEHAHEFSINEEYIKCNTTIDSAGNTLLHKACEYNSLQVVVMLERKHFQIQLSVRNHSGDTPLHICCQQKNWILLKTLLWSEHFTNKESALSTTNNDGDYPLSVALKVFTDCPSPIDMLRTLFYLVKVTVARFCHPEKRDYGNLLHLVCQYSTQNSFKILKFLKSQGAKLDSCDGHQKLPLHYASSASLELVKLCGSLSNVNSQDCDGNTPLHIACSHGKSEIIHYLITEMQCCISIQNKIGESPLHKACSSSLDKESMELLLSKKHKFVTDHNCNYALHVLCKYFSDAKVDCIRLLVKALCRAKQTSTVSHPNEFQELPLHFLCKSSMKKAYEAIKILLLHTKNLNVKTLSGNTPLHLACLAKRHDIIQLLVEQKSKCDITLVNMRNETPLHLACYMQFTASECDRKNVSANYSCFTDSLHCLASEKTINAVNIDGDTPLHIFLKNDFFHSIDLYTEIIELYCKILSYLLNLDSTSSSLRMCNNNGEFPIHLACRHQDISAIKLIGKFGILAVAHNGDNILHCACRFQDRTMEDIEYLLQLVNDTYLHNKNSYGNLPMHLCCKYTYPGAKILMGMVRKGCNIHSQNNDGNTPLHLMKYRINDSILDFIVDHNFILLKNNTGKTFLDTIADHGDINLAEKVIAKYSDDSSILRTILSQASENFLLLLYLSFEDNLIQLLFEHKINPNVMYTAHSKFFNNKVEPPQIPVTMLFIGDSMTGKTTLINSLKKEANYEVSEQEPERTAGVVSSSFRSQKYGLVTAYDFAGQREYYASHEAMMQSIVRKSPPIVLLNVKLTDPQETIMSKIFYWSNFINNRLTTLSSGSHLIIIFSHADQVSDPLMYSKCIHKTVLPSLSKLFTDVHSIPMDCRKHQHMTELILRLSESSVVQRHKGIVNFNAHCLYVFLYHHLKDKAAIRIGELMQKRKQDNQTKQISNNVLPDNIKGLMELCEKLSEDGLIMFIRDSTIIGRSWIILKKKILLEDIIKEIIHQKKFLSSTCVVPFSVISNIFSHFLDPNMVLSILQIIEYCYEIQDQYVVDVLFKLEITASLSRDKYYFFPALVITERPSLIAKWHESGSIQFGWVLKCNELYHHFTPKFIQTLLLRFVFGKTKITIKPIFSRAFKAIESVSSIWKSGLRWCDGYGVDTFVDVVDIESKVVVLMQCKPEHNEKVRLLKQRASIMNSIKELSKEICPAISTMQYFVHSSNVAQCLTALDSSDERPRIDEFLIPISDVYDAIGKKEPYIVTKDDPIKTQEFTLLDLGSCLSLLQRLKCSNDEEGKFWSLLADSFDHCKFEIAAC